MRPIRRTLIALLLITVAAATLLRMQAAALADAMAQRQLRLARAAAVELGAAELAVAIAAPPRVDRGPAMRTVDTAHGRLSVRVEAEPVSVGSERLRVTVTDEGGQLLTTHETVLKREAR